MKSHFYILPIGILFWISPKERLLGIFGRNLSPWAALTWPGSPQLDHSMGAPYFILRHALVDAFVLRPHADHPQGPTGQPQALAGGEGHSVPQPQHRGWGVPAHVTGELGALAPWDDKLGQLHSDLRGFCQETRAGMREG